MPGCVILFPPKLYHQQLRPVVNPGQKWNPGQSPADIHGRCVFCKLSCIIRWEKTLAGYIHTAQMRNPDLPAMGMPAEYQINGKSRIDGKQLRPVNQQNI